MPRLRGPLFSLGASGRLARAYVIARRLSGPAWLLRGRPDNPNTPAQRSWRTMWQLAASLWHDLSAAEQAAWERDATPRGMTGYAWYMSQALRPNPGIYLPLAGGTMAGNIDMDGNLVTAVLDPIAEQDAATKKYHDDNLPAGGYTQGARVRSSLHHDIPHNTPTIIPFNAQDFDTDDMWEGVINPTRVTIKTAGIYLVIGMVHWETMAAGYRDTYLYLNGATVIAQHLTQQADHNDVWRGQTVTTYQLAVTDFLELRVYQNSGANLEVRADGPQSPVLSAQRIG